MDPYLPSTSSPSRWRRGVYAASLVIPFTGSQIWALLILLRLAPLDGLVGQATVLILLGSVVAVWAAWRWTWRLGAEQRPKGPQRPQRETAPKTRIRS